MIETKKNVIHSCHHCGDECKGDRIEKDGFYFCCNGCESVYTILNENGLCNYYDLDKFPGQSQRNKFIEGKFAYLDNDELIQKLTTYSSEHIQVMVFTIPSMHCNSCIWLLEKLYKLDKGIVSSSVDFYRKTIQLKINPAETSLRKVVELLTAVGYEPEITLEKIAQDSVKAARKSRLLKLGVAGFCFGNIMLMSFPDYLANTYHDPFLENIPFRWIGMLLALPVFFYSASEFYTNAWTGLKKKMLNIDAPVFLAVLVTFLRSVYEVVTGISGGYFDSMSGIVFFMLLGRVFQDITYKYISFDKNSSSFIPIAIAKKTGDRFEYVQVTTLEKGDIIAVRNDEIIPVDGWLNSGRAAVDYSFVTGESEPRYFHAGEKLFAGGRQTGASIELTVAEKINESYLRSLWKSNFHTERQQRAYEESYIHKVSKWFTLILFIIGAITFTWWMFNDATKALDALTTILIVACPCVLLLSHAFAYGFLAQVLNRNKIYLRDVFMVDRLLKVNHIAWDKTGTLTSAESKTCKWQGIALTNELKNSIYTLASQSAHPKSKLIQQVFSSFGKSALDQFISESGKGISGIIKGKRIKIGSALYIGTEMDALNRTFVSVDDRMIGYFEFNSVVKDELPQIIRDLSKNYPMSVISGDNDADRHLLSSVFPAATDFHFNAMPEDKVKLISELQRGNKTCAMIGDGMNDADALMQSDLGIAIAGQNAHFVPACDIYVEKDSFRYIAALFSFFVSARRVVLISFLFAILYNSVGLFFAVTGSLTPGIAAVLMPLSTLTIIAITFFGIRIRAKQLGFS